MRRLTVGLAVMLILVAACVLPQAGTALVVERSLSAPDAIIPLASHEWERLPDAIALGQRHPDARVILTEPAEVTSFNCHDCAGRVDLLRRHGINADRIHVVKLTASGTYGEAVAVRTLAARLGLRQLLVVTSPYHTRRALATLRSVLAGQGVDVGIAPAASPARPARWWATPYDRWYVRYEWAAATYYAVRYGIMSFP